VASFVIIAFLSTLAKVLNFNLGMFTITPTLEIYPKARPTGAEITDAAMGQRAECVMLNKGIHILEAVKTLSGLLSADITLRTVMCFENLQSSVVCLKIERAN